ncbi:MAG: hypothetical protein L0Z52_04140 [Acidobacteria bacterium]|nr:hypothetical protein [Acidobacteriota bacterium]
MAASRWQEVSEEVGRLCDALEKVPEACECGDAESHLEGGCRCCHGHASAGTISPGRPHCGERIEQLRADLALLCEDFKRAAGPFHKEATGEGRGQLRRELLLVAGDLSRMMAALEDLDRAVVGFQRTCSLSDMKGVKRHAAALLVHCRKVDAELARSPFDAAEMEPEE